MQTGKIYTFKLNSGEEMIAKVISTSSNQVELQDPVSVAPGPQGMGLIPAMFTADPSQNPWLNMSCVTVFALTDQSVCDKYIEATTGIRLPEKKILVG